MFYYNVHKRGGRTATGLRVFFTGRRRQRHTGRREKLRPVDGRVAQGRERVQVGPDQGIRERRERGAPREFRFQGTVA